MAEGVPDRAKVKCVCGDEVVAFLNGPEVACNCGAGIKVELHADRTVTPWVFHASPSRYEKPEIVGWLYPTEATNEHGR
jgi:hypothetical protein